MFTNEHLIGIIAIVEHPLGDDRWGMFAISKNAYLRCSFDECSVKLLPRTTS